MARVSGGFISHTVESRGSSVRYKTPARTREAASRPLGEEAVGKW